MWGDVDTRGIREEADPKAAALFLLEIVAFFLGVKYMWAPSFVSAVTSAATVSALRPSAHDAPRVLFAALDALTWYLLANNVLLQVHQYPLAAVVVAAFLTRYALHAVFPSLTKDPTTDAVSSGIRRPLVSLLTARTASDGRTLRRGRDGVSGPLGN